MQKHSVTRYIGPKIWNELPQKVKLCKSLSIFVKKSKAFNSYVCHHLISFAGLLFLVFQENNRII